MNEYRNLQDILSDLTHICTELAQHEAGVAQSMANAVKVTPEPEDEEVVQPPEAELVLEQKKREMVQRDANIAAECKALSDEYMQLKATKDEHLKKIDCLDKRMSEIDDMLDKLGDERDVLHRQWCAEIARPANSQPVQKKPAQQKPMTRAEWVKALGYDWTDEEVKTIVRRIGELVSGRITYSRLFFFAGAEHNVSAKFYSIDDLRHIGEDIGIPFPG